MRPRDLAQGALTLSLLALIFTGAGVGLVGTKLMNIGRRQLRRLGGTTEWLTRV